MLVIVYEEVERTIKVNGKKVKVTDVKHNRYSTNSEAKVIEIVKREKAKRQVKKITVGTTTVYERDKR